MLPNALKDMDYGEFLALGETRMTGVRLDTAAALSLCRKGVIPTKAPLAWLGIFWLSLIAAIPTVLFWNWQYAPFWLFIMWLAGRRSKAAAIRATWREIKGKGSLTEEQRDALYQYLVEQNMLVLAPEGRG